MANKKGSSQIENDKRIRSVQEWLMSGHCTGDIITKCVNKYDVTSRQAYNYIKRAYKEFKKISEEQIEERRSFHIETRLKLYRDLKEKNSSKSAAVAVDILKDIAKLEGLYVEKQEITMPDGLVITVNFKEDD